MAVYVVDVFVISTTLEVEVKPISVALCHLTTFPVNPDKVNWVELAP